MVNIVVHSMGISDERVPYPGVAKPNHVVSESNTLSARSQLTASLACIKTHRHAHSPLTNGYDAYSRSPNLCPEVVVDCVGKPRILCRFINATKYHVNLCFTMVGYYDNILPRPLKLWQNRQL